jgi:hypothetical protein
MNRSYWNPNPLMLRFGSLQSSLNTYAKFWTGPLSLRIVLALAAALGLCAGAAAQSFSLQMSDFDPIAVNPGGNAISTLTLDTSGGFTGTVDLTCSITPAPVNGNAGCLVSPSTVTPPTGASVTIQTASSVGSWAAGGYTITITGTPSAGVQQVASARLSVLSVTPSFTITVGSVVSPSSVPAGSSAVATININPINGYAGTITMGCSSVSPLVDYPPVCTFNPTSADVSGGAAVPVQLTLNTIGPLTTTQVRRANRPVYAFWLPLPLLALVGLGAAGGKKARVWGIIALLIVGSTLLLTPACSTGTTTKSTTPSQYITPNGSYTFTVTGVDANGASASNNSSGTLSTVTLTVTTGTTN